jgi:Flp pilus assembly protein protease CpaA
MLPNLKFYIEIGAVVVLVYIGLTDFRTFKIRNEAVFLLFVLYVSFALTQRSWLYILSDVSLATIMFIVLLLFYANSAIGGGDVKFMTVVCLWVGVHCALLFSLLLLLLIGMHIAAAWMSWVPTKSIGRRSAIPYAPSIAGALGTVILLGCL